MSVIHFDKSTFTAEVIDGKKTALVDFWAEWCGPCKMLGPIIDSVATEITGDTIIGKINVDENQDLATQYQVMSIPTIILFKDGVEVQRVVGLQAKQKLIDLANS